jgi:protein phosphatase
MITDEEVSAILRSADDLETAAESLVRAANQSGGKDNITVVLFRLGEDDSTPVAGPPGDEETIAGQLSADDVTTAATAVEAKASPAPATLERRPQRKPRRRGRAAVVVKALLGVAVVAAAVTGLYALSRQVYFVGTNDAGLVTIYRGVPYELPLGVDLYEEEYASGMPARAIPTARRERVLDHEWRSREDAVDLVRALERGQLEGGRGSG